jgi:hypothetical protein
MFLVVAPENEKLVARVEHQRFNDGQTARCVGAHDARHAEAACGQRSKTDQRKHKHESAQITGEIDQIHEGPQTAREWIVTLATLIAG